MRPVALSDEIAVGEMPSVDEIAILAKAGFRSILNVQPDGEVERLLSAVETGKGAAAASLNYAHLPVSSRRVPDDVVAAFANAMVTLPRPIYACCYSGARAAAAWALAVAPTMAPVDIAGSCAAAGYDMSSLLPDLERRHAPRSAIPPAVAALATSPLVPDAVVAGPATLTPQVPSPATAVASAEPAPTTAAAAISATERIIFPRAAGAGGFAVSG